MQLAEASSPVVTTTIEENPMTSSIKQLDDGRRWLRAASIVALGLGALLAPSACGGHRRTPAEQVGHEIDDTAEDVEETVDEATE
jgi:hypothetical protein